jgi:hypothetical protein
MWEALSFVNAKQNKTKRPHQKARHQWLKPIILVTQEAEIRRIAI